MKKLLILFTLMISMFSCTETEQKAPIVRLPERQVEYRNVSYTLIVKDLKEVTQQVTNTETKVNWTQSIWQGDLKTQLVPNIHTVTHYYVIYTNNTNEEIDYNTWLNYSKGDTITKWHKIPIN